MGYWKFFPARKYRWHVTPLKEIKEMLLKRQNNELDNMIMVTGARGSGKSTLTGKILFQFPDFVPYECMVYSKEEMFKLIKKQKGFIWADESVVNVARGNTMTRASKLLFEATTINRDNLNIVFFCMPFVEDFDTKILQYITAWIHVDRRGLAVLMLPSNKGIFGKRNWDIVNMKKIYDEFIKQSKGEGHTPYWIYDNFRGYIKFGKLTLQQDAIVKEIKALRKNENIDKTTQEEVVIQVKSSEDYLKYSSKKIAEMIAKGEIRDMKSFELTCQDMKLEPKEILSKCDSIFKKSNVGKTVKQTFKEYDFLDSKIQF